jgi:anaerobic ribonucleoside-triphosphate reductase activating protein
MNLGGIVFPALNAYDGIAYEIYVSGCTRACPGCHSPDLQDFKYGKPLNIDAILKDINEKGSFVDIISVSGGDLLCQDKFDALRLSLALYNNLKEGQTMWLFTGEEPENIPEWVKRIYDVIVAGPFKQELFVEGRFPASTNQKVLVKGVDY